MTHLRRSPRQAARMSARAGTRRPTLALVCLATVGALVVAGCTPGKKPAPIATSAVEPSGTVEFWHFFTDREAKAIDEVIADFRAAYPKVTVNVQSGQDDAKVTQAIAGGTGPDVGLSYSTDIVGKFCASGAWVNLKDYLNRDKIDLGKFPKTVLDYTEYKGNRCSMPFLADVYGIYYNKAMFDAAGITAPPKTLDELADMAKKLTKRKADGTIEVAGFLPLFNYYENSPAHTAPMVGAKWLNADGTSAIGGDSAWQDLLKWQKSLVDWFGYDKLEKFRASLGDEFSADNAFHKGQVAINIDAEYRIAFIEDQAKDLKFGTAPLPVKDSANYGGGYVTGNVIGISKTAKNPEAAWALIRYLTTNTKAIVKLANLIKNIPTTNDALASPDLHLDPAFQTFIDMFKHPKTSTTPPSSAGPAYQETFQTFLDSWQTGKVKEADLPAGLKEVDKQINALLSVGG
jgi:multiple sugar transport system substrate-binding protein